MANWKNVQYKNGQYRTSEGGSGGSSTLSGLDDVTISSASNGQVLKYNSTSSKWVNANDVSITALEDLTDVDVDSKSDGDVLTYNEAQDRWEAAEPLGGGVTDVEVDGLSVVNDGIAVITTPDAGGIEYDNQQSGLSAIDVQSAIDELSQSTGVSTLSDLTDTAISSPSNNQVLTYDTTTSKWKNANATGGASTLNDLTDVDTTGVLDNNFLAYSQAQSKWVPATVSGGGNVDDVQVNGISVVTNKVAQIKSYKEVTLQQYQQLPSSKTSDGVLYCITDAGGADGFPPLIYSDEEREVGVWRDGKPLYQKTIKYNGSVSSNTWHTVIDDSDINENISSVEGFWILTNGSRVPLSFFRNTTSYTCYNSGSDGLSILQYGLTVNGYVVTIQYTKTTDTPGSGTWTTQGTIAHHYDGDEKVIGTWFGETLYEKSWELTVKNHSSHWITFTECAIPNFKAAINIEWSFAWGQRNYCPWDNNGTFMFNNQNASSAEFYAQSNQYSGQTLYYTVQYTKTTD